MNRQLRSRVSWFRSASRSRTACSCACCLCVSARSCMPSNTSTIALRFVSVLLFCIYARCLLLFVAFCLCCALCVVWVCCGDLTVSCAATQDSAGRSKLAHHTANRDAQAGLSFSVAVLIFTISFRITTPTTTTASRVPAARGGRASVL